MKDYCSNWRTIGNWLDFVVKRNWIQNVHFLSKMGIITNLWAHILSKLFFDNFNVWNTLFSEIMPNLWRTVAHFILKTQRFLSIMLIFGQNFKVNILLLYLFYFIISTGLLGFKETYWFCRFEKPRSHLLHEQFAASPIFYQQPTQICLQNAYWGRRQVIYQGVLTRKPIDRQIKLV